MTVVLPASVGESQGEPGKFAVCFFVDRFEAVEEALVADALRSGRWVRERTSNIESRAHFVDDGTGVFVLLLRVRQFDGTRTQGD